VYYIIFCVSDHIIGHCKVILMLSLLFFYYYYVNMLHYNWVILHA